jgi:hypothetical protein
MCAGGSAGGLLAGHTGCIISPLVIAATGATAAGASSGLALALSAAAAAGGLYLWKRLRGKEAGKWEKRVVVGGALAGLAFSSAFHLAGSKHHHGHGAETQTAPPRAPAHDHAHMHH